MSQSAEGSHKQPGVGEEEVGDITSSSLGSELGYLIVLRTYARSFSAHNEQANVHFSLALLIWSRV